MSGRPAKRRKEGALAWASVPAIDSLPPELLETIFGGLNVRTLCTARLVCAQLRSTASQFLHSLEISIEALRDHPETTLNNFPNLRRVTVFDVRNADLLMLARLPVGRAVTHVRAVSYVMPVLPHGRIAASCPLLPLPNLASLTFRNGVNPIFPFPETLRELSLGASINNESQAVTILSKLTNLTCLQISLPEPFEAVTALTALQRLEICSPVSVIPLVAELTLLTHLQFQGKCRRRQTSLSDLGALATLTDLHRLVHLGFSVQSYNRQSTTSLERQVLSSIATLTGLMSLDLGLSGEPEQAAIETLRMTPVSQLTALRLRKNGDAPVLVASFLPLLNIERLQALSLSHGVRLDRAVEAGNVPDPLGALDYNILCERGP